MMLQWHSECISVTAPAMRGRWTVGALERKQRWKNGTQLLFILPIVMHSLQLGGTDTTPTLLGFWRTDAKNT